MPADYQSSSFDEGFRGLILRQKLPRSETVPWRLAEVDEGLDARILGVQALSEGETR